jgi:hypothetical protein
MALPRVPQPQTSPPCRGGLRHRHVSHGPRPHLLAEVSSGAATYPTAQGSAFLRGEIWCYHVFHGHRRAVDQGIKKCLAALDMQLGSRVSKARLCVTKVYADVQVATVSL